MTTPMHHNHGICPVCNGSGRRAATDDELRYAKVIAYYDTTDHTVRCRNCGGQYMFGTPKGFVKLNNDGKPCKHEYSASSAGRCLTTYYCKHCGDTYQIDSSD